MLCPRYQKALRKTFQTASKDEISTDRTAETQQVLRIDTTPQLVLTTDVDKIFANLAEIFTYRGLRVHEVQLSPKARFRKR